MNYIKKDTKIKIYTRIPEYAFSFDLTSTAALIYGRLFTRALSSQKNGYIDESGNVYVLYTIDNLVKDTNCSRATVEKALKQLEERELIKRMRTGRNKPNKIYVGYYPDEQPKETNCKKNSSSTRQNKNNNFTQRHYDYESIEKKLFDLPKV